MTGNGEQQLGKADTEQQHRTGVHGSPKPASNKNKYKATTVLFSMDFAPQLANIKAKPLSALHCKQNLIYIFPEMKLRGLVSNFHMHVSVSD
jgi:hypothetical protein